MGCKDTAFFIPSKFFSKIFSKLLFGLFNRHILHTFEKYTRNPDAPDYGHGQDGFFRKYGIEY